MIRKLRIKLIAAAMSSLVLVLIVLFSVITFWNYNEIVQGADKILDILSENDGSFPIKDHRPGALDDLSRDGTHLSPELPYETRYFTVFLTNDNTVISVNTGKIAAVDSSTAVEYALEIVEHGQGYGFKNDYRYKIYDIGGETHIIFLDYGREMSAFRTFLLTTISVSALGLTAVLFILLFLSGRIIRPFSENYEKQKRFITDAGHELKTPLTIIAADAEVLEMDVGESEWIADIKSQIKRLAELTNNLILLSRMDEQPQMEKIDFPVSDVTEEIIETFQALAKTCNKKITGNIEPMISICGYEKAIRQLITILLDNAVKYSDEEGMINVTLRKQKNMICLSVFNTVDHIGRENLSYLFDRFYRSDKSRSSKTKGYGLGLSIATAIVNAHKGKIAASTQDEKSLQIDVSFPI